MNQKSNNPGVFPSPIKILAFNPDFKLAGIFLSYNHCEKMTGIAHQLLVRCCKGDLITTHGFYWRELPADLILESDDIGTLDMIYFDKGCGNDFKVYASNKMNKNEVIFEHEYELKDQILKERKRHGKSKN